MENLSRRKFIRRSLQLATVGVGSVVMRPYFAFGQSMPVGAIKNLVVLYLDGGIDGLGSQPYTSGSLANYLATVRPLVNPNPNDVIEMPGQAGLPNKMGLHPNWAALYNEVVTGTGGGGLMCLKNVGIVHSQNGSHDGAYNNIALALDNSSTAETRGWFARVMDHFSMQSMQAWVPSPTANIPDFRAYGSKPMAVSDFTRLAYPVRFGSYSGTTAALDSSYLNQQILPNLMALQDTSRQSSTLLSESMNQVAQAISAAEAINNQTFQGNYAASGGLSGALKTVVKIMKFKAQTASLSDLPTLFYISRGGFDTHGSLPTAQILDLAESQRGFVQDLKQIGAWNETVIILVSEFGRTTRQNRQSSPAGTDHAWGNNLMMLGGRVRSGVTANDDVPLNQMQTTNYTIPTLDLRAPLAAIIQAMGGTSAVQTVFPGFSIAQANQLNLFT